MGRMHIGENHGQLTPLQGPRAGAGKGWEESSAWGESGLNNWDKVTTIPITLPLHCWAGRRQGTQKLNWILEEREDWGKVFLWFGFTSHCPTLMCLVTNQPSPPSRVCFAHGGNWWVSDLSLSFCQNTSLSLYSLSPVPPRRRVGTWHPAKISTPQPIREDPKLIKFL